MPRAFAHNHGHGRGSGTPRDLGERFVGGYKPVSTTDYLLNCPFKD